MTKFSVNYDGRTKRQYILAPFQLLRLILSAFFWFCGIGLGLFMGAMIMGRALSYFR